MSGAVSRGRTPKRQTPEHIDQGLVRLYFAAEMAGESWPATRDLVDRLMDGVSPDEALELVEEILEGRRRKRGLGRLCRACGSAMPRGRTHLSGMCPTCRNAPPSGPVPE